MTAALAAGAIGCGGKSDSDQVRDTIRDFIAAVATRDGAKACELLATSARTQIPAGQCPQVLSQAASQVVLTKKARDQAKDVKVEKVKITGDSATAVAKRQGRERSMLLRKEGGKWRIAAP